MKSILLSLYLLLLCNLVQSQDKPAYQIFDKSGQPTTFEAMQSAAQQVDYVFFGELHNNPIAHWLQLELTQALLNSRDNQIILGFEMLESDNQLLIDEYLLDLISKASFEDEARLWNNYQTDYKPLLELAKANNLYVVASNIPRRYANLVFRQGLDYLEKLPARAHAFMAPLPIPVDLTQPAYAQMMDMMGGHGTDSGVKLVQAQAVKDATMAHFIEKYWQPGYLFLHFNGSYHSNQWQGIVHYATTNTPDRSILTINTVEQTDLNSLNEQNLGLADFTICIPSTMTKTY